MAMRALMLSLVTMAIAASLGLLLRAAHSFGYRDLSKRLDIYAFASWVIATVFALGSLVAWIVTGTWK